LIPAGPDDAVVAPVITQVRVVTAQLSAIVALGTVTEALQTPASTLWLIFEGHVIVGLTKSFKVTETGVRVKLTQPPLDSA
jgi:hypothetical protein